MFVLTGLAIFAPVLATDRPLYLRGIDFKGYASSLRELPIMCANLERLLGAADPASATKQASPASQASLAQESMALSLRLGVLEFYAPASAQDRLEDLRSGWKEIDQHVSSKNLAQARQAAASFRMRAEHAQTELAAKDPRLELSRGLALRARSSLPALASLGLLDRILMLAWFASLLYACVVFLVPPRVLVGAAQAVRSPAPWIAVVFVLAALLSAWSFEEAPRAPRDYKAALQAGDLVAGPVRFALIPFGYSEQNLSEPMRPPTWSASSESGARAPVAGLESMAAALAAVEQRYGEPMPDSAWRHVLGTDGLGRDLLARILWGGRASLGASLAAAALLTMIGTLLGAIAGWWGGRVDWAVSRLIEIVVGVPTLFVVVLFAALCPPHVLPPGLSIVSIMAAFGWTGVARLVRGQLLSLRNDPFVESALTLGASEWRQLLLHALPGAFSPALVAASFAVGSAILVESAASYLGFGIAEPVPSWGALIQESSNARNWWMVVFPGTCIFATVASVNALAESLRARLDRN